MPNHQLLDNVAHKDLRIITEHSPEYDDSASYTNVITSEFQQIQAEYPIFFRKNSNTGQFEAIALFGLADQENLFLSDSGWHAHYIPLTIQRRPFLIGFQRNNELGKITRQPVVHIDMDSPRVNTSKGESVFLAQGEQSPFLHRISSVLNTIQQGHVETKVFIDTLLEHGLIESVAIKVELNDGSKNDLAGLYTIHEEKVANLRDELLSNLHQRGYLKHIHMILASMSNFSRLIEKKNQRL